MSASSPIVSIITPTYAHAGYIRECLESVVAQSVAEWEAIVVDDGSPDETLARAAEVADDRIHIVARPHVGLARLADTYNAGLERARGRFVAVLEGDDRWPADALVQRLEAMRDPSLAVCYGRLAVVGSHGRLLGVPPLPAPVRGRAFDALGPMLLDSLVDPLAALIRRDALIEIGGFRQLPRHHHVDYATFLALAERGPFHATDRVVAHWRRHSASSTVQAVSSPANFEGPRLCRAEAIRVRRAHPERTDLPGEAEIAASWERVLARRYWHGGRILQAQRRWREARRLFLSGLRIKPASLAQRAMLALGVVASVAHLDLERLAAVRGGSSLTDL